jgi:acetoacetyl-CoA reductase
MGILSGRSGFVTGAGRGIGRAIALELGRNGANVAVGYSASTEAAEQVARLLSEMGVEAFPVKVDVSKPDEVRSVVATIRERFGKIDFLVNNAGINRDRRFERMSADDWNAVIEVNLNSIFHVTHEVLPHMLEQGYGRIVNISSVVGEMGNFGQTNYATAKAGMIGFSKSLAIEVARKGITVNCLAPGFTETDMVAGVPQEALEKVIARIPMGRLGKPEEMAAAALFLIGSGDYITGEVLSVNGGMHM